MRTVSIADGVGSLEIRRASVNRFGFLFEDDDVGMFSEEYMLAQATEEAKETVAENDGEKREMQRLQSQYNERLEKWMTMTKRWNQMSDSVIKKRVRKGLPDPFRAKAWRLIIESRISRDCKYRNPEAIDYAELLEQKAQEYEHIIELDAPRSFPKHIRFREADGEGQTALRRTLKAYAVLDPEVGYCQGMSFIMAVLLMYFTEEEALWAFWCLMHQYGMREMFLTGLPKLQRSTFVLEKLIAHFFPKLTKHLVTTFLLLRLGFVDLIIERTWMQCYFIFFNLVYDHVYRWFLF